MTFTDPHAANKILNAAKNIRVRPDNLKMAGLRLMDRFQEQHAHYGYLIEEEEKAEEGSPWQLELEERVHNQSEILLGLGIAVDALLQGKSDFFTEKTSVQLRLVFGKFLADKDTCEGCLNNAEVLLQWRNNVPTEAQILKGPHNHGQPKNLREGWK